MTKYTASDLQFLVGQKIRITNTSRKFMRDRTTDGVCTAVYDVEGGSVDVEITEATEKGRESAPFYLRSGILPERVTPTSVEGMAPALGPFPRNIEIVEERA